MCWEHHEADTARMRLEMEIFSRTGTRDGQEVEMVQNR